MMRTLVASSRPKSSIIMVVDQNTGKPKYHVRNKTIPVSGDELTDTLRYKVKATVLYREFGIGVLDLAKRRYRRAIRIYREKIDNVLRSNFTKIPDYRDSYISEIILLIDNQSQLSSKELALLINDFIEQKNNGS